MLLLKDKTVEYQGLADEMLYALGIATALKWRMYNRDNVLTSGLDGTHNPSSLHPKGLAVDLRCLDLTDQEAVAWYHATRALLEPVGFDIVFEGGVGATPVTTGAHMHIEFDPKGRQFWHYA